MKACVILWEWDLTLKSHKLSSQVRRSSKNGIPCLLGIASRSHGGPGWYSYPSFVILSRSVNCRHPHLLLIRAFKPGVCISRKLVIFQTNDARCRSALKVKGVKNLSYIQHSFYKTGVQSFDHRRLQGGLNGCIFDIKWQDDLPFEEIISVASLLHPLMHFW